MAELVWTAWPAKRSPGRAALAIAFMTLMGWTIQSLFHTGYFTVVAVLLVWGQVASFFLPTTYMLTGETVAVRGLITRRERRWQEFRSYYVDGQGALLSPFVGRSRLERFRGVSLQFHGSRDAVVEFVEKMMERREAGDAGRDTEHDSGETDGHQEGQDLDVGDEGRREGRGEEG